MKKIGQYVANQTLTASPAELILMLFDEGIRSLKKAEAAFDTGAPERFEMISAQLLHTQDVIRELMLSLNMEKGGDVAANLKRIYDFMLRHLVQANVEKDKTAVADVRELLATLREAWLQVVEKEQESRNTVTTQSFTQNHILAAG